MPEETFTDKDSAAAGRLDKQHPMDPTSEACGRSYGIPPNIPPRQDVLSSIPSCVSLHRDWAFVMGDGLQVERVQVCPGQRGLRSPHRDSNTAARAWTWGGKQRRREEVTVLRTPPGCMLAGICLPEVVQCLLSW